jgi:hypothetical protein
MSTSDSTALADPRDSQVAISSCSGTSQETVSLPSELDDSGICLEGKF